MGRELLLMMVLGVMASAKVVAQPTLKLSADSLHRPLTLKVLPPNFYQQHLAFTCKKELQLQKLVALPVYIRLGSKECVDYLERKPNAGRIINNE